MTNETNNIQNTTSRDDYYDKQADMPGEVIKQHIGQLVCRYDSTDSITALKRILKKGYL